MRFPWTKSKPVNYGAVIADLDLYREWELALDQGSTNLGWPAYRSLRYLELLWVNPV